MFIPTVDLAQRDTVRLVSSGRLKAPVLSPLAANEGALVDLVRLETATSGRLRTQQAGLEGLAARELVYGRSGWTFINAAFSYTRIGGNRFNDDSRGAWYAGFAAETALAEVSFHLGRELAAIGRFDNTTDYAELLADFIGPFHDIRQSPPTSPFLHPEPEVGYPAGQALARDLAGRCSNGIVYPSVRRPGGTCLVAFRPDLVQNVRQGEVWRLQWRGSSEPSFATVAVEASGA